MCLCIYLYTHHLDFWCGVQCGVLSQYSVVWRLRVESVCLCQVVQCTPSVRYSRTLVSVINTTYLRILYGLFDFFCLSMSSHAYPRHPPFHPSSNLPWPMTELVMGFRIPTQQWLSLSVFWPPPLFLSPPFPSSLPLFIRLPYSLSPFPPLSLSPSPCLSPPSLFSLSSLLSLPLPPLCPLCLPLLVVLSPDFADFAILLLKSLFSCLKNGSLQLVCLWSHDV